MTRYNRHTSLNIEHYKVKLGNDTEKKKAIQPLLITAIILNQTCVLPLEYTT